MRQLRFALVPVCAALCSAILAHVAIDIAGDYLLAHDTYDDLGHGSRSLAAVIALLLAAFVAVAAIGAAVREARGSPDAFRRALTALIPRNRTVFTALVTLATPVLLAAMESLDALLAGEAIPGAANLFGGSIALGAGVMLGAACVVSAVAWHAVYALTRKRRAFVAFAVVLVRRTTGHQAAPLLLRSRPARSRAGSAAYCRQCAGRAPPTQLFVPAM